LAQGRPPGVTHREASMSRFTVVFDDLPVAAAEQFGPVAATLTYGMTFSAESPETARQIAENAMRGTKLGAWHIEPAPEPPVPLPRCERCFSPLSTDKPGRCTNADCGNWEGPG
jgi:hypothetical protein